MFARWQFPSLPFENWTRVVLFPKIRWLERPVQVYRPCREGFHHCIGLPIFVTPCQTRFREFKLKFSTVAACLKTAAKGARKNAEDCSWWLQQITFYTVSWLPSRNVTCLEYQRWSCHWVVIVLFLKIWRLKWSVVDYGSSRVGFQYCIDLPIFVTPCLTWFREFKLKFSTVAACLKTATNDARQNIEDYTWWL